MCDVVVYREAVGSYAENQRITAVRKVYQRGIVNPMINIEILWKDYCAFEQVMKKMITKEYLYYDLDLWPHDWDYMQNGHNWEKYIYREVCLNLIGWLSYFQITKFVMKYVR